MILDFDKITDLTKDQLEIIKNYIQKDEQIKKIMILLDSDIFIKKEAYMLLIVHLILKIHKKEKCIEDLKCCYNCTNSYLDFEKLIYCDIKPDLCELYKERGVK
jgi:predicted RNase H-related nuclease YkuK (DUF458 family)